MLIYDEGCVIELSHEEVAALKVCKGGLQVPKSG